MQMVKWVALRSHTVFRRRNPTATSTPTARAFEPAPCCRNVDILTFEPFAISLETPALDQAGCVRQFRDTSHWKMIKPRPRA